MVKQMQNTENRCSAVTAAYERVVNMTVSYCQLLPEIYHVPGI